MASKDTSTSTVPSDMDIMMYLDGELDGAEAKAVVQFIESNEEAKLKAQALTQMSELLQGSIELQADDAESQLAGLWAGIDKGIQAKSTDSDEVAPEAKLKSVASKAEERATEALVAKSTGAHGWIGGWQSHIITSAFVAVAVAVLMIATRPDPTPAAPIMVRTVTAPPVAMPVVLASQDPEVEELEVYDGSGVVMTIPAEDGDDGDSASTVIWISDDTDVVEDPI